MPALRFLVARQPGLVYRRNMTTVIQPDTPNIALLGHTRAGTPVHRVTLRSDALSAQVLTLGAALQDLRLAGIGHPLVLGWPSVQEYEASKAYLGVIVGRLANRLGNGRYTLDGRTWRTDRNFLGRHTLHGGSQGTDRMVWEIVHATGNAVTLQVTLQDGHMGFGGDLTITATFQIEPDCALSITLQARTRTVSLCNLTPHVYFNLDGTGDITAHELTVMANSYTPVDDALIPTGEVAPVAGTRLDFRTPRPIGTTPLDHNFCLSDRRLPCRDIARLRGPHSGVEMVLQSTEPGLQIYSGTFLNEPPFGPSAGVALEPQVWPDAPNHRHFPSVVLRQGEIYRHVTRYMFPGHAA